MSRVIRVAAAQMGGNQSTDSRQSILERMIGLLEQAAQQGATLVVFPELAFTTFFPRMLLDDGVLAEYFETQIPSDATARLFECARELGIGFYVGYAEQTSGGQRFNTSILVAPTGEIVGKYRKIHLPGSVEPRPDSRFQQLEKRYFEYGDTGFPVFQGPHSWQDARIGMLICNDRRWPEAWRCLALQGMELLCVGYNSAAYDPNGGDSESPELRTFHALLAVQGNAYMNACWAVAVAKAGVEDGAALIGGSCIVDPNGIIVAQARTLEDELLVADCDLDMCLQGRTKMFNFDMHRRPQWYRRIVDQVGIELPKAE